MNKRDCVNMAKISRRSDSPQEQHFLSCKNGHNSLLCDRIYYASFRANDIASKPNNTSGNLLLKR